MKEAESFQPIINKDSCVLVLGSTPGITSLIQQQYYANPRNQFWKIIYLLFSTPFEEKLRQWSIITDYLR